MTVTAPSDRNFRRRRVSPGRRASLRHRWKAFAVVALGIAIASLIAVTVAGAAISSRRLSVARIVVSGAERITSGEIESLIGDMRGANLLTLDLDEWHGRLRSAPWVANVAMRRVFPDAVLIALSERVAVGVTRVGDSLHLIDRAGVAIDPYGPHYADLDLPLVNGFSAGSPGMEKAEARRAVVAARLFHALQRRPDLARRVSEIDLTDPANVAFLLKGDNALVRVGDDKFTERLQTYIDFAQALHEQVPDIDYVDVRYDDQIVVRSRGESAVVRQPSRRAAG